MNYSRLVFFFLLSLITITSILSLLMPVKQTVEKSIQINAPAGIVFEQLVKLENFNQWSVWNKEDSSVINTLSGIDGTVGATSSWKGHQEISGEGTITIEAIETNKKVKQAIQFKKPKENKAFSYFSIYEQNGITEVDWTFELATPRPWNIFNLFYSLDKTMGKDFEDGLQTLKSRIENLNSPS